MYIVVILYYIMKNEIGGTEMGKLRSLMKIGPYLKKNKLLLMFVIIGVIASTFVNLPIPYMTGKVVDEILIKNKSVEYLLIAGIIMLILYGVKYLVIILSSYLSTLLNTKISNGLKVDLICKIINLPMDYLGNVEKGYLQGRIAESNSISASLSTSIIGGLVNILDIIFAITAMFVINVKLAFMVLLILPVFFLVVKISNEGFTKVTTMSLEANAKVNAGCFEIINGIEEIKVLDGKQSSINKFKHTVQELIDVTLKQKRKMLFLSQNISGINDLGTLLILLISGIFIIKGNFTVGLYTTFVLYSTRIFNATQFLANIGPSLKQTCLSLERIYEFLDMDDENGSGSKEVVENIENIKFENVTFKYKRNSMETLKNFNLEIVTGDKVLIRGQNGSGKTTLIKLLERLYEPQSGRILINGKEMKKLNIDEFRKHIGIVSQNIFLFSGSVLDNILYGQEDGKREEVENLIKKLNLKTYIDKLPKGLDTEIIENNNGISGGQKQVIAFIRAVLSKKDVIILDEPIANIDIETRKIILEILKERFEHNILIIVSHFSEGLDFVNKIVEIKEND